MDAALRRLVRQRAGSRCEFCRLQETQLTFARFHIEHVIPRQHGGVSTEENLALACHHCNLHKGPNLTGIDPETETIVPLFHPRRQTWDDHFLQSGARVFGRTPTGRATVRVLDMNSTDRVELRSRLLDEGIG
jgi:hypothetical protein